MISADVKADIKQQEIKELIAIFCNFFKKVPAKLECTIKQTCIFYLILLGILPNLILYVKNREWGIPIRQNLLSVTQKLFVDNPLHRS